MAAIRGNTYLVEYQALEQQAMFHFIGKLQCSTEEYRKLAQFLETSLKQTALQQVCLDLTRVEFMNSSGINMLSEYCIAVRNHGSIQLQVQGDAKHSWQPRVFINLQKLMRGQQTIDVCWL